MRSLSNGGGASKVGVVGHPAGLRRRAARAAASAAATAVLAGGLVPGGLRADTIILNNGETKDYTPAQAVTTNGVSSRAIGGQAGTVNSSIDVNYNASATAVTSPAVINTSNGALDAVTGIPANTGQEFVGKLSIATAGAYTIWYNTDDGGRLYVDGVLIINNEGPHGDTRLSKVVNLDAGLHDIQAFVVNAGGGGGAQLSYSGPDQAARAVVPTARLFQAENAGAVSATVRPHNITPVGTAPENVVLGSGVAATLNFNGTNYAIAGLNDLSAGAGSTLNVTGSVGGDTRRMARFASTTFNGGAVTLNPTLDLALGAVGGTPPTTLTKTGPGRLVLDNIAATGNNFSGTTIDIQSGTVLAVGSSLAGSTNPLGAATVNVNGGALSLDSRQGSVTFDNLVTLGATGGTIQTLSGPATYTLSNAAGISIPGGSTLTVNTFGGSHNVVGSSLLLTGPLSGSGALVKTSTPGSTAGVNANIVGTAANRDTGFLVLTADSSGFSGPITLATTAITAPAITAQAGVLEGRPAAATSKVFGTGGITSQGGQINLRGNGPAANTVYELDNALTLTGNTTIDMARITAFDNSTFRFNTLSMGGQTLTVNTANGFQLRFTGATTLTGNPTINLNTNSPVMTAGTLDDGGTARTITKTGGGNLTFNTTATSYTGAFNVNGGNLTASAENAIGSALVTLANSGSQVTLGLANAAAKYDVAANTIFAGNVDGFSGITRTAAAPGPGQVRLAFGAVVAEQGAGQNAIFAANGGLGTNSDLIFGIAGNVNDSMTVSIFPGTTPWRGVGTDRNSRNLTGGTITALSSFAIQPSVTNAFDWGAVTVDTPNGPVVGNIFSTAGNGVRLRFNAAPTPLLDSDVVLAVQNAGLQLQVANALGANGTAAGNARVVAYPTGLVDPGGAGAISGDVFLKTRSLFQVNDNNNFGGLGSITGEPGVIVQIQSANVDLFANVNATQTLATLSPGTVFRMEESNKNNLQNATNPAGNFQVHGGDRTQSAGILLNAAPVNPSFPGASGFAVATLNNDGTSRALNNSGANPQLIIGPGGGTLAASSGTTLTVSTPVSVTGSGGRTLQIGTNLVIDPDTNNNIKSGTVTLNAANNFGSAADGINQVNVVGRATLMGTPSGTGTLPQGPGVGLRLGGTYQINGPAGGGTVQLGQLTPSGGVLFLNRNASATGPLTVNLNAPINRAGAFGAGNRGSTILMLTSGQAFGTSTDKVTFANAADAPPRLPGLNMVAPWLVGTDSALPSANSTFLDIPDPTGAGFVPVTYVPVPTTGGTGTEIADAVGATTLAGDINVAALRANNNISGAFTINLATGGLLVRGATAGPNISANVNFGAAEGVVGLAQVNQVTTISGKVSGTNGLTKFGQATLILSNATNDFTGGVTVNEANLRAGVASTATASPFGFSGGAFNVVTINPAGTLDINNLATRIGGLQGSGVATNLGTTANTVLTVDVAAANTLTFNGALTDGGSAVAFTKVGSGSQILAGTIAHSGATTVSGGTLQVDGFSTRASAYAVNTGATLAGRGIITGAVTVSSGGNLAPGASPGTLRTGNLTLAGGSNFHVELNGTTAGTGYDQVDVIGTVNVTDANLVATLNYAPSAGDLLYVINNDQLDFVTGTFAALPQGATLTLVSTADNQSYPFTISYTGEFLTGQYENIGNDVVLRSVIPEPASVGLLAVGALGLLARRRRARVA